MKKFQEKKIWLSIIGIISLLLVFMGLGVFWFQKQTEASLTQNEQQTIESVERPDANKLYKDSTYVPEDVIKKVCERFNLDYETVTNSEITDEMIDYQFVYEDLLHNGDKKLLKDPKVKGNYSGTLEESISEIYAFHGAKEVIEEVCNAAGIDASTAKIGDLSEDTLLLIHQNAYQVSDHPKD